MDASVGLEGPCARGLLTPARPTLAPCVPLANGDTGEGSLPRELRVHHPIFLLQEACEVGSIVILLLHKEAEI